MFSDGSESFNPLGREELDIAQFPDLDVVRSIVGPYEVFPTSAEASI